MELWGKWGLYGVSLKMAGIFESLRDFWKISGAFIRHFRIFEVTGSRQEKAGKFLRI